MNRRLSLIVFVLLVVLAGCHGGGDGGNDDPDREVDLVNEETLATSVDHYEPAEVKADVTDEDSVENVTLNYTVYDRAGDPASEDDPLLSDPPEDSVTMEEEEGNYVAEIPGMPAGYNVSYEVQADYGDETVVEDSVYTVSYVDEVDGPLDGEEVDDRHSPVSVSVHTTDDIERVEVVYTRELTDGDVTKTETVVLDAAGFREYEGTIGNLDVGEHQQEVTIDYHVRVVYGPANESHVTENRTYEYVDDTPDVLYVGVKFDESDPDVSIEDFDQKAEKTNEYLLRESRGKAAWRHETVQDEGGDDGYFVLPGEPEDYLEVEDEETDTEPQGDATITVTETWYSYDRMEIFCTAREVVEERTDIEYNDYQSVVFTHPHIDGSNYRETWTTENETMRIPDGDGEKVVEGNGNEYIVKQNDSRPPAWAFMGFLGKFGEVRFCDGLDADHLTRFAVVPNQRPYGTIAHELGHSLYGWEDYYNTDDSAEGIVGHYGLMGSGSGNDGAPSQVMAHHKIEQEWIEHETIESDELDDGESRSVFIPYMGDSETVDPEHRAVKYKDTELTNIALFDQYLFEARDPPRDALPEQPGSTRPSAGLVAYTVDETLIGGDKVNLVQSVDDQDVERRPSEPTIDPTDYETTVHDPDLGVTFELDPSPRAPEHGLNLTVTKTETSNVQGVNVFTRVDCTNITVDYWCSRHSDEAPENVMPFTLGLYAHTDEGTVGVHPNGSVVDEVEGAEVVSAGAVRKVYVPDDVDARYEVDSSAIPEEADVNVTSQTVTRDEDGDRIASDLSNDIIAGNDTAEPELARLNVSDDEWHAGQLRTLEDNETTITVQNTGIAELENVTVETDSDLLAVNETDLGTLEDTEESDLELDVNVPGGTPVGAYTANVTVVGDGTTGEQNITVAVTVEVLPTVHWSTTSENANASIDDESTTTVVVTTENHETSNVPLRDVASTVTGNVTAFDIDGPTFVETVAPGETVTLETAVAVPEDGIEEGTYDGVVEIEPLRYYGQYFDYPVDVSSDYAVPDPADDATELSVTAHGPSVEAHAEFHPGEQVAMRQGAAAQHVQVDPVDEEPIVPVDQLTVRSDIPDGWEFNGNNPDQQIKVWIVADVNRESPGKNAGERTRLDANDYDIEVDDDEIVLTVADLANTTYGDYMDASDVLEFEFKINKQHRSDHDYSAAVDVETASPIGVYRFEQPIADIDVFDPRPGSPPSDVVDDRARVPQDGISVSDDPDAIGTNATLTAERLYRIQSSEESDHWMTFRLDADDGDEVRTVLLPVERTNDTVRLLPSDVTDDGQIVLDGIVTRTVQGSIASGLRTGDDVRLLLPADDTADVEYLEPAAVSTTDGPRLESADGNVTVDFGVTVDTENGDVDLELPVIVGDDVLDRANHTDQSADRPRESE